MRYREFVLSPYGVIKIKSLGYITRTGVTLYELASEVGVSKSTVHGWKSGAEPKHGDGESLVAFWCRITSRGRDRLPMIVYRQQFIFRSRAG
ncbi:hypothetical protein [Symbiopectobacterium purcellii]|uniref:hypothetical protein n=1 Tax=Symbiopectobacterium purcellii TaxID=2871826 RepID=UPI003F84768E